MNIILTDDKKNCPDVLPDSYGLIEVSGTSVKAYSDNRDVKIVLCTRGMAKLLENLELPNCRLVQLFSVGLDDIDLTAFKTKGVPLCNASGVYDNVLAEYVVHCMLQYAKRYHRNLSNRLFRPFRNYHYITELAGKTIGIMGVGRIGTAVANHLAGFGMSIIGYARHTDIKAPFEKIYHREDFKEFLCKCDYIVNVLPHDESTKGIINADVLESVKSNMVFINIGRNSIFHGDDFYRFMKTHKGAIAILDMFEILPNPLTNKYRRLSNVMVTPRISAVSQESTAALKDLLLQNIKAVEDGTELKNRIV